MLLNVAAIVEILEEPPVAVIRTKCFVGFFFFFKPDQLIDGT